MFVLALLGVVLFVVGFIKLENGSLKPAKYLGVLLFLIGVIGTTTAMIGPGEVGVRVRMGKVNGTLNSGFHIITPLVEDVIKMDVKTTKVETTASASSRDLQTVSSALSLQYSVSSETAATLYEEVGLDYKIKLIDPLLQESVKSVTAQYTAEELIRLRPRVKSELEVQVREQLLPWGLIVPSNGVSITNFEFSNEFNQAIEAKQVAQQEAEKQKYILQKAEMEAQAAVTKAKGEAEANSIKAKALNSEGGQKVLFREWIEKWDGRLPTVSGGGDLILDLKSLGAE